MQRRRCKTGPEAQAWTRKMAPRPHRGTETPGRTSKRCLRREVLRRDSQERVALNGYGSVGPSRHRTPPHRRWAMVEHRRLSPAPVTVAVAAAAGLLVWLGLVVAGWLVWLVGVWRLLPLAVAAVVVCLQVLLYACVRRGLGHWHRPVAGVLAPRRAPLPPDARTARSRRVAACRPPAAAAVVSCSYRIPCAGTRTSAGRRRRGTGPDRFVGVLAPRRVAGPVARGAVLKQRGCGRLPLCRRCHFP